MNAKRILGCPVHPILVSVYPILHIYSNNIAAVPVSQLAEPLLILTGSGLLVWALAAGAQRSLTAGALTASLTMLMALLYRHFWVAFSNLTQISINEDYSLLIWCYVWLTLTAVIWKMRRRCERASRIVNVFSFVLVAPALLSIAVDLTRTPHRGLRFVDASQVAAMDERVIEDVQTWKKSDEPPPDIYYIILDGYGRHDRLQEIYNYDNQPFLEELRQRGFFVAERSTSNYPRTTFSLTSSLNMDFVHQPLGGPAPLTIQNNRVTALLRAYAYQFVVLSSGYPPTDLSERADVTIDVEDSLRTELASLLYEWSIAHSLAHRSVAQRLVEGTRDLRPNAFPGIGRSHDLAGTRAWARYVTDSLDATGKLAAAPGPKFVFAHVICPHPPYVFRRDGSLNQESSMGDLSDLDAHGHWVDSKNIWKSPQMVDQIIHLNKLVLEMIDHLLQNSPNPPVIIVHADHGTFASGHAHAPTSPSDRLIQERMAILFACYAPQRTLASLYHQISPVNLFRILFNTLFEAQYPLLPDRCYWSYVQPPPDVTDIAIRRNDTKLHLQKRQSR
jgi:hypothetical protein